MIENPIFHFFVILLSIILVDSVYLGLVGEEFMGMIRQIQGSQIEFRKMSAVVCYILLSLAILYFIYQPRRSLVYAFLLGFIIYGVYETTSYALIKKWSLRLAIIDTVWGGVLFVLATLLSKFLIKWASNGPFSRGV